MKNKDINLELKKIVKQFDSDDVSNKIIGFLGLNMSDNGEYDHILDLAAASEKPGKYAESERLKFYEELKRAIENLE